MRPHDRRGPVNGIGPGTREDVKICVLHDFQSAQHVAKSRWQPGPPCPRVISFSCMWYQILLAGRSSEVPAIAAIWVPLNRTTQREPGAVGEKMEEG